MLIDLQNAIKLLNNDEIVAVPTETVYGLAARFDRRNAIKKIYAAKERPLDHPLIVHIDSLKWVEVLAQSIPDIFIKLAEKFWPGPLTMVLSKSNVVDAMITASQDTVAIRMPKHQLFLELINKVNCPLVAPSANKFCKTSPTSANHVESAFLGALPVLDGGESDVGIESTILDLTHKDKIILLRPGVITTDEIESISKLKVEIDHKTKTKSAGMHSIHYRPNHPVILFENVDDIEKYIEENAKTYYVMSFEKVNLHNQLIIQMPNNPIDYARAVYRCWHNANQLNIDAILIQLPPKNIEWQGVIDRIYKAGFIYKN